MKKFQLNLTYMVFKGNLSEWLKKFGLEKMVTEVERVCKKIPGLIFLEGTNIEIVVPNPQIDAADIRQAINECFYGINFTWFE